ncbi:MAG: tRNA pseudouridine(55) synthase TruB [Cyclobacteriaceae bacterium]|nr:tRNA pseudouridine(55) synthase TruB [Cyclobacteriaceae bacterium]
MHQETSSADRLLLVNKPLGWTSFDVVNKLRYKLKIKKIGHAGTLDPLATGLLIICTGKMTKQIEKFMGLEKEYTGTLMLGQTTPSHDLETPVSETKETGHLTDELIYQAANQLTGTILQTPPVHSAIRIGGKRAYALARKGKELNLQPREVLIKDFTITAINLPAVQFKVVCSKGTYIRSLVRDFGDALGVGAHLSQLCRTRIGSYQLADALSPEQIQ